MAGIAGAWRSFWHTMTSNDRHASHDSPYRTGQHVPLSQSRHAPLTSVATNADESRIDLTTPDPSDPLATNKSPMVAASPYTPGMRSAMRRTQSGDQAPGSNSRRGSTEIQMQAFNDGLPPPPPVNHSWKRIDGWLEDKYQELWDNLGGGCTQNDINELEHELDCTLPLEVRESLMVHDGQERGGRPTGVIFSSMLLDCEEIVQEWKNWRTVNEEYFSRPSSVQQDVQPSPKAFDGAPSSSANPVGANERRSSNSHWKEDLLSRQDSQPSGAIQKVYSHPSWIPLARDWGGNHLAVDLAPGPSGKWGQVILFGRDYDCKYVISRSWAAFLATVADDLYSSKVEVNEDSGEMKLRAFKNAEPPYLEILRWRADQKYGRKQRQKSGPPGAPIDTRISNAAAVGRGSPYGSPTASVDGERGRSPQRFSRVTNGTASPREAGRMGSPLARVNEELPLVGRLQNGSPRKDSFPRTEKLVSTESTPRASIDIKPEAITGTPLRESVSVADDKENMKHGAAAGLGVKNLEAFQHSRQPSGEMKTVEI